MQQNNIDDVDDTKIRDNPGRYGSLVTLDIRHKCIQVNDTTKHFTAASRNSANRQ